MIPRALPAVVLALLAAGFARAGDGDDDGAKAAASVAAARISAFGNWCRGRALKRTAREQWEAALRLDPEEAAARAGLGHVRGEGGWKKPDKPDESPDAKLSGAVAVSAYAAEMDAAYVAAGAAFAEAAEGAKAEGDAAGAKGLWNRVLFLDPSHAGAREALGHSDAETGWLKAGVPGPGATRTRFAALAKKGEARLPSPSAGETFSEQTATESPYSESSETRFRVRSYYARAGSRDLLRGILEAEALLEGVKAIPPRTPASVRLSYFLMASKKAFQDAIRSRKEKDEKWREARLPLAGTWWNDTTYMKWTTVPASAFDSAVHVAAHQVFEESMPGTTVPAWLNEGVAHAASTAILGTGRIWCISLKGSAFEKDLAELKDWDEEAREDIRAGRDPSLASMHAGGYNDLTAEGLVKGRSVAAWLLATAPGALARIVQGRTKDLPVDEVFLRALGAPPEAVERRWRCWALLP